MIFSGLEEVFVCLAASKEDVLKEGGLAEDGVRNLKSYRFVECGVRGDLVEGPGTL